MTYLLALFLSIAKRRDDLLLKMETGVKCEGLCLVNILISQYDAGIFSAIIIVFLISCLLFPGNNLHPIKNPPPILYFRICNCWKFLRYLQITFVFKRSGSPTEILYKDRLIPVTLLLWVLCSMLTGILYLKGINLFFA
jgi:hypothetical protein